MRVSTRLAATTAVVIGLAACAGSAVAAVGDEWNGSGWISVGGTGKLVGGSQHSETPPEYLYSHKRITFTLTRFGTDTTYVVVAKGRLFGDPEFTGAHGQQVTQHFAFAGPAAVEDAAGATLCSGRLVAGGRWDGEAFGELTLPGSCAVWSGRQYLSIVSRVDGTSVDSAALVER